MNEQTKDAQKTPSVSEGLIQRRYGWVIAKPKQEGGLNRQPENSPEQRKGSKKENEKIN